MLKQALLGAAALGIAVLAPMTLGAKPADAASLSIEIGNRGWYPGYRYGYYGYNPYNSYGRYHRYDHHYDRHGHHHRYDDRRHHAYKYDYRWGDRYRHHRH